MAFGVTDDGFVIKRLSDIKEEIESSLRTELGSSINLLPTELLGQIVGIMSEREALVWEALQDTYNSQYPDSANGTSLDNVVALTGIERLDATFSTAIGIAYGTEGTVIPEGSVVSVSGNPDARFAMDAEYTIGPGTDEVQTITFSNEPTSGSFTLIFDGEETAEIAFDDVFGDVQTALNALTALSAVTVTGNYTTGFVVTFTGADGEIDQEALTVGDNTLSDGADIDITITETTKGVLPNVECELTAETAGATPAYADTLTVIEDVVAGWDSFNNDLDATVGKDVETDAELRLRRAQTLASPGAGTVEAIRAELLEIDEVEDAIVYTNREDTVDADGRPPHSLECVVLGGEDADIYQAIFNVAPAGIYLVGDEEDEITDSQGFLQTVRFNRPFEVDIYIEVDITTDSTFPISGDTSLVTQILEYCQENFSIGDDVVVFGTVSIASAIGLDGGVTGIIDYEIRVGIAASPTLSDNIDIESNEIAAFDSSRILVTVL